MGVSLKRKTAIEGMDAETCKAMGGTPLKHEDQEYCIVEREENPEVDIRKSPIERGPGDQYVQYNFYNDNRNEEIARKLPKWKSLKRKLEEDFETD